MNRPLDSQGTCWSIHIIFIYIGSTIYTSYNQRSLLLTSRLLLSPSSSYRHSTAINDALSMPEPGYVCDAGTSKILGKAYQKKGRHKAFPTYTDFYGPGRAVRYTFSSELFCLYFYFAAEVSLRAWYVPDKTFHTIIVIIC